jgi:hypothetical protein
VKTQQTVTGFDLLEGAFEKVRRARLFQLLAVGLAAAACVGIAAQSIVVRFTTESLSVDRQNAVEDLGELTQILSQEADTRGLNRAEMERYLAQFGEDVAAAAQLDAPVGSLVTMMDGATPPQVEIRSLSVRAGSLPVQVTVAAATTGGYSTALSWREALAASPMIAEVSESWSGEEGDLGLTMELTLSDTAVTARSQRYIEQFTLDGVLDVDDRQGD